MDIRNLTSAYSVSPQIDLTDLAALKAGGYYMVIDNRPDAEIPPHLHIAQMRGAAEALGLIFISNPVVSGAITLQNITAQADAIAATKGPILAYCASGNRSSIVWALSQAGQMSTDDLIAIPAQYGYQLEGLRNQIDSMVQTEK
jgi:uncharacterized protein (TIGR01244 family)